MVEFLQPFKGIGLEVWLEERCPVIGGYQNLTILCAYELGVVDFSRLLTHLGDVIKTPNFGPPELPLEEAKTPIGAEFSMANNKEGYLNLLVQSDQNSPRQVHQHVPVLILAGAVVGMKVEADLTEAEVLQMEVEHADYSIRPLPGVYRLVNQVIHLKVFLIRAHLFIFKQHTCLGMASQQMPKIAHFLGVRKYIGPGCCGSLG